MSELALARVYEAYNRIRDAVRRTALERVRWTSGESPVFFKLECLQVTGSFKARGALAALSNLTEAEKRRGVLTVSAGNHGLAVAHAAALLGIDATIVVPRSASVVKVEGIRKYPVSLIELGEDYDAAERSARRMESETGKTFVSPYNDAEVIAGQGTIALEILEDQPDVEAIVVPVGGGGLLAGVAVAAKALKPDIKVYGAEPAASSTMTEALKAGRIVQIEEQPTIADGLAGNIEPGSITFPIVQQLVDKVILVTEESTMSAIEFVARQERLIIEGSAAVAVAALEDAQLSGLRTVAILSGRNISLDLFMKVMNRH